MKEKKKQKKSLKTNQGRKTKKIFIQKKLIVSLDASKLPPKQFQTSNTLQKKGSGVPIWAKE
jgi:hypothetical protein